MALGFAAGLGALAAGLLIVFWMFRERTEDDVGTGARTATALGLSVAVAGLAYGSLGDPTYLSPRVGSPTQGLAADLRPVKVAVLERFGAMVAADTADRSAWIDVAQALLAADRPLEASEALAAAAGLTDDPVEQAALFGAAGETRVRAIGGDVDPEAAAAFRSALSADPTSAGALYYLGRRARAAGDAQAAGAFWDRFLAAAPDGHPLASEVRSARALLGAPRPIAPVLDQDAIRALDGLDETQRTARIAAMLASADARLSALGADADAEQWRELARAYLRLGDLQGARTAYGQAVALAPNDAALALERSQLRNR